MKNHHTIKINFRGGIISPGDLLETLEAASLAGISKVSFGLRQQLILEIKDEKYVDFLEQLSRLHLHVEKDGETNPNIMSSYPAEEVFITKTWLSEGVYKDIFDLMDFEPKLKINICDCNQSFTPMLTGNLNWVASSQNPHFWHFLIRFPGTNTIYEWKHLLYTNDIARMSKDLEQLIMANKKDFYHNPDAKGDDLFKMINLADYITKHAKNVARLPSFNLPYYEGLNRYNDKYWLGIYRRDEMFDVDFLKDICHLCLQTKIGQVCCTSWKSLMIKGITEKDRFDWNNLLAKHRVNVRHAANELNFQVEDHCSEGLKLKNFIVRNLSRDDIRTFGICIGIKTRKKSEVFSSILVNRKALLNIAGFPFFHVYDILCATNFNPNERTGFETGQNIFKFMLPAKLRKTIILFYEHQHNKNEKIKKTITKKPEVVAEKEFVHQCPHCLTIYDSLSGEPENNIAAGTGFEQLPATYCCSLCEAPKDEFIKKDKSTLLSQAV
jgi:rubredoxin